jgi:sugar lactone lactonase YvrE
LKILILLLLLGISSVFVTNHVYAEDYVFDGIIKDNDNLDIAGNDIAFDSSGNFFISDSNSGKIIKFSNNGNKLLEFDGSSIPDFATLSGTGTPTDITIDSSNHVYVAWWDYHRITKHDSNGNFLLQIAGTGPDLNGSGTAYEHLQRPIAVDVVTSGNIYVSDNGNNKIKVFDSSGNFIRVLSNTGAPYEILVNSANDRLYYVNDYVIRWVGLNTSTSNAVNLSGPDGRTGLTMDSSGNIWSSTIYEGIQQRDPDLSLITVLQPLPVGNNYCLCPSGIKFFDNKLYAIGVELQSFVVNTIPTPTFASFEVDEDSEKEFLLTAEDPNLEQQLAFQLTSYPTNGNLFGTAPNLTYTPNSNFHGTDSFTFKVNDGILDSDEKIVSVTVSPINDTPLAGNDIQTTLNEDTSGIITLVGQDVDEDTLSYSIITNPTSGVLSGIAPNLTYTPNSNFHGTDSFTFKVNDGILDSIGETANLTIFPINDIPTANAGDDQSVDSSSTVTLDATQSNDVDGDSISYHWVQTSGAPVTLTDDDITNPKFTTPISGDTLSFMLTVSDGTATSNPDIVNIYVGTPVPQATAPPVPTSLSSNPSDSTVVLNWQTPDDGGSTITDYVIEYKSANSSWSTYDDGVSSNTISIVSGLENNVSYQFRISAVNSVGTSDSSSLISATPISSTPVVETPIVETPIVETPIVETPIVETPITPEPTLGIASFVDQTKNPQHYIDRYFNEPTYKKWFDENYPQYNSIYQAIGLDEPTVAVEEPYVPEPSIDSMFVSNDVGNSYVRMIGTTPYQSEEITFVFSDSNQNVIDRYTHVTKYDGSYEAIWRILDYLPDGVYYVELDNQVRQFEWKSIEQFTPQFEPTKIGAAEFTAKIKNVEIRELYGIEFLIVEADIKNIGDESSNAKFMLQDSESRLFDGSREGKCTASTVDRINPQIVKEITACFEIPNDSNLDFKFIVSNNISYGVGCGSCITNSYSLDMPPTVTSKFIEESVDELEVTCGTGTIENKDGICVLESSKGGGCLIATATYGSEMALEVQQLRELRDNTLLQTESGTAFMGAFNDIYYSFSPTIADYERENPLFKEAVKLAITPMISSLSLMENAESESEVLSIGISVIALNLGMYLGVPAIVVVGIRKKF